MVHTRRKRCGSGGEVRTRECLKGFSVQSILIVGAALAGWSAARAARAAGYTGAITMIGAEDQLPYDRPPLSKDYLAGTTTREDLGLDPALADLAATWLTDVKAVRLDTVRRTVSLTDGRELSADAVILATGAWPNVPEELNKADGGQRPNNLNTLRTADDADWLRARLKPGTRLLIIGAGLIGAEVAATARSLGCEVTMVAREKVPMDRVYGAQMAEHLIGAQTKHGVRVICEAAISDTSCSDGQLSSLTLVDGTEVEADVVLVAIGAQPSTHWLNDSGLEMGDGVICDPVGRTSAAGIWAVGDCAAWLDPRLERAHRTQHWTDAMDRPAIAVAAMLGIDPPVRKPYLPYFWSDQYDLRIQMAGYASLADRVEVIKGDPAAGPFLALYFRCDEPVAVLGVSEPREFTRWRRKIATDLAEWEIQTRPSALAPPAVAGPSPYLFQER